MGQERRVDIRLNQAIYQTCLRPEGIDATESACDDDQGQSIFWNYMRLVAAYRDQKNRSMGFVSSQWSIEPSVERLGDKNAEMIASSDRRPRWTVRRGDMEPTASDGINAAAAHGSSTNTMIRWVSLIAMLRYGQNIKSAAW